MAHGFNWGILSLLFVVVAVLGGVTSFFVYIGRRSASLGALPTSSGPASAADLSSEADLPVGAGQILQTER
jgi:hypothetical protein